MINNSYNKSKHKNIFFQPKILYPFILLFLTFLDGSIPAHFFSLTINPSLTLIFIFYLIFFSGYKKFNFNLWVFLIGLIFDLYYTEILGIYLVSFSLSTYFLYQIKKKALTNFFLKLLILLIVSILFYIMFYICSKIGNQINFNFFFFLISNILPNSFFNIIIGAIFYKPFENLMKES